MHAQSSRSGNLKMFSVGQTFRYSSTWLLQSPSETSAETTRTECLTCSNYRYATVTVGKHWLETAAWPALFLLCTMSVLLVGFRGNTKQVFKGTFVHQADKRLLEFTCVSLGFNTVKLTNVCSLFVITRQLTVINLQKSQICCWQHPEKLTLTTLFRVCRAAISLQRDTPQSCCYAGNGPNWLCSWIDTKR